MTTAHDDGAETISVAKTQLNAETSGILPRTEGQFLNDKTSGIFEHFWAPKMLKRNGARSKIPPLGVTVIIRH